VLHGVTNILDRGLNSLQPAPRPPKPIMPHRGIVDRP
jgi:hypothetical protein